MYTHIYIYIHIYCTAPARAPDELVQPAIQRGGEKYSGVRVSLFAGSAYLLNQSALDIYNRALYKAKEQAESYEWGGQIKSHT